MHEVTIASTRALPLFVLSTPMGDSTSRNTPGLSEICHWRILRHQLSSSIKTVSKTFESLFGILFVLEFHVHISNHVLVYIITDMQLLDRSIRLREFGEHLFIKFIELLLLRMKRKQNAHNNLLGPVGIARHSRYLGVVIHMRNENCLAKSRSVVLSSATVPMTACSNLKIERTVHSTHLNQIHAPNLSSSVPYTLTR